MAPTSIPCRTTGCRRTRSWTASMSCSRGGWRTTAHSARPRCSRSARRATKTLRRNIAACPATPRRPRRRTHDPHRGAVALGRAPHGGLGNHRRLRRRLLQAARAHRERGARLLRDLRIPPAGGAGALDRARALRLFLSLRRLVHERESPVDLQGHGVLGGTVGIAPAAVSYTHLTLPTNREV